MIPDILCNSGGVVVSYFEWVQDLQQLFWEEEEVTRREYHILDRAFEAMVARARADNIPHRTAAMAIGVEKVRAAKNTRGLFPMITGLDHVVILVSDLAAAAASYQTLFARTPAWRGSGDGAERVLFTLDNMTLELMVARRRCRHRRPDPQRDRRAGRGTGQPLLPQPATSTRCIAGWSGCR